MVLQQRDVHTDKGSRVEVEEADVAVQAGVARVEAVALGKHHPAARVEARVNDAAATRGGGTGSPRGTNCSEADIVGEVGGQQARG
ncbi:unnamed protein product [Urochloa humidicola]